MYQPILPFAAACLLGATAYLWPAGTARPAAPLRPPTTRVHVQIPPQSLATKTRLATAVVHGVVAAVGTDGTDAGLIRTTYTIAVQEWIVGEGGAEVTVRVAGGSSGGRHMVVDAAASLSVGDELVLFLWSSAADRVPGILGLRDGVLQVQRDESGRKVVATDSVTAKVDLDTFKNQLRELRTSPHASLKQERR